MIREGQKRIKKVQIWPQRGLDGPVTHTVDTLSGKKHKDRPRRNSSQAILLPQRGFLAQNGQKRVKKVQIWPQRGINGPVTHSVDTPSDKKHRDKPHWAATTLVKQFSCRNMDVWSKNGQKRVKRVQIWPQRGFDGPVTHSVDTSSGEKHKDRPHWAAATLVKQFSCRNMDFWPKIYQN